MTKQMIIAGINNHLGFSVVSIEVRGSDDHIIDAFKSESQTLSFDELWTRSGRKAARQLRKLYNITEISKPKGVRL